MVEISTGAIVHVLENPSISRELFEEMLSRIEKIKKIAKVTE